MKFVASLALSAAMLSGCTKQIAPPAPVTVTIGDGNAALTYDCSKFQPLAKSHEQIMILRQQSTEIILKARGEGDLALARSLRSARELRDYRRMEELIIEFECAATQRAAQRQNQP